MVTYNYEALRAALLAYYEEAYEMLWGSAVNQYIRVQGADEEELVEIAQSIEKINLDDFKVRAR